MPDPQPGTLSYIITAKIAVDVKQDEIHIILTDGTNARINHQKARNDANLENIPHQILVQLWNTGTQVNMRRWRAAIQRRDASIINDTVDKILSVLAGSATPSFDDIRTAARDVLVAADRLGDWSKLNTLLQSMDETQLRQFLAFIILILLNKAAGEE